ncbi:MAG: N-acetylmuramoyl-L-alanine amidase [Gammaproteobacteria bacterium]
MKTKIFAAAEFRRILLVFCTLLFSSGVAYGQVAQLNGVSFAHGESGLDVILTFDQAFDYKSFTLPDPARAVIDISNADLTFSLGAFDLQGSSIKQIRTGQAGEDLRIVFDLQQRMALTTAQEVLPDESGYQLIVTLAERTPTMVAPVTSMWRDITVVIDPGHGGNDPGAVGAQGLQEKEAVLSVSQALGQLINTQKGLQAILTRHDDSYVNLRERLAVARDARADFFVSIHADAFNEPNAQGVSVFALSESGATNEAAHWLAEKENYSEVGGVDLSDLYGKSEVLRSILIDLSQASTINTSIQFGSEILQHLQPVAKVHGKQVEQAGFMVLKSPDIPSILVETGFISNPEEELKLGDEDYRQDLARAIYSGMQSYIGGNLPEDSLLAIQQQSTTYEVVSGDSLSMIAQTHQVDVSEVRGLNSLSGDTIFSGQQLLIPPSS